MRQVLMSSALGFVILCLMLINGCGRTPPAAVTPTTKPGTQELGIGLVVVIDVSGSMNDTTLNNNGSATSKIQVAREVGQNIVHQTAEWAKRHPDQPVYLSLITFSDGPSIIYSMTRMTSPDSPEVRNMLQAISMIQAEGATAIGDASLAATTELADKNMSNNQILLITDGENTAGTSPQEAAGAIFKMDPLYRPSFHLFAFDVDSKVYDGLKPFKWSIIGAADGAKLKQTIDEVVGGEILLEK